MRTSYERGNSPARKPVEIKPEKVSYPVEEPVRSPVNDSISSSDFYDESVVETPSVSSEQQLVSKLIVEGYIDAKRAMASQPVKSVNTGSVSSKKVKTNEGKKSRKGLIVGVIFCLLAAVAAVLVVLVSNGTITLGTPEPTEPPTEPYEPQYSYIAKDIGKLFVDEEKTKVATWFSQEDINQLYDRLNNAKNNGEDVKVLEDELNTISCYLDDVFQLNALEDVNCDLSPNSFVEYVMKIKISADSYSVPALKEEVCSRADALLNMRQTYMDIKMELLGVSDLRNFDKSKYEDSIKLVKHSKNMEELTILLAKVSAESDVVKAEVVLAEAKYWEEQQAAKEALDVAKSKRDEAVKAWLAYIGESAEEPTEVATETTEES